MVRSLVSLVALALGAVACSTPSLTAAGERVVVSTDAPASDCVRKGDVVGEGGGSFGGAYVSNDDLIEYAFNDLRNEAADLGANYVQHEAPTLGESKGTTTTATVHGTAYACP